MKFPRCGACGKMKKPTKKKEVGMTERQACGGQNLEDCPDCSKRNNCRFY